MNIATRNGSIIVKDGNVAENCDCCGGWVCDQQYGACCSGTECVQKYLCDCAAPSVFRANSACGGTTCACVYPTLDPLPGAITNPEDPLIGRRLPIYCTISDGRHTFSGNYSNIQTFFPTPASILAVYGQEAQGASTSTAVISMQPAPFFRSAGVGGEWARYLALYCGHGVEPCCGEIIDGKTFVNVYFSCDATTGAWVMQWNTAMVCYRWALGLCGVSQEYDYKVFSQYNDSGSITIPAASNGLPEPGTHSLASASPTGVPCEPGEYIRNASITISHS